MMNQHEQVGFSRKMTKQEIRQYPLRKYDGPIRLINTWEDLLPAVNALSRETVLGFDSETRPAFVKGESYPPALLQLAGSKEVYIFQLTRLKLPKMVRKILADPAIIKAGVSIDHDKRKLQDLGRFHPAGFVDLGDVARYAGIKNHGLRGLAAVVLGFSISKQSQRSNWAREVLTPGQLIYAATDAWVSRELYLRFKEEGFLTKENQIENGHALREITDR